MSFLSNLSYRVYLAGLFLIPVGAFASLTVPFFALKVFLAFVTIGGAFVLAVLGALKSKSLPVPKSWLLLSLWLPPVAYGVSALFSSVWQISVFGSQLDTDTLFFMALLALTASLPIFIFQSRADFVRAFFAVLAASWVVALFHFARLFFGADTLSFGVFTNPLFSLVGKWNDLSIFFGFIGTLSLITLEALPLSTRNRWFVAATLAASLFFVALVNYTPVWIALGVLSLGVVLYRLLLAKRGSSVMSVASIIVLVLALCGSIFASTLGTTLGGYFGTAQIEARPSFGSTMAIASKILATSPWLGSGPNTFTFAWDKYRPSDLNQSIFWNADFSSGVGFIPTSLVTAGGLGAAAWLVFLALFIFAGIRALLLRPASDPYQYYLTLASYAAGLYVLAMAAMYLPSPVILLIGFAAVGMFIALDYRAHHAEVPMLVFQERPRIGFIAVLGLTLVVIFSAVSAYAVTGVFVASTYYESAIAAVRDGSLDTAQKHLATAGSFSQDDRQLRLATLINLSKLNTIVNSSSDRPQAEVQQEFQNTLGAAVESGLAAIRYNQNDYRNWQAVAGAYQSVVPLNIKGAYESAVAAYEKAAVLNPSMPSIPLSRAQLEIAKQNTRGSRQFIDQALQMKQDYIPALLLLAQIELANGNLDAAIKQMEAALVFEPSNPVTHFQVGVLKFEDKDYKGAEDAFTAAVTRAPDYANAHYYLGRVYIARGNTAKALEEFGVVQKLNPDNTDVANIIASLKDGKDPFAPVETKKETKK